MSHFTTIKTKISEESLLLKSLDDLKLNWSRKKTIIDKYNKNNKYFCDIIIEQIDYNNVGFFKENNSYKLIYDEMFWNIPMTISLFNQKIDKYYTFNLINKNLMENGFDIRNLPQKENCNDLKIKINAIRFK